MVVEFYEFATIFQETLQLKIVKKFKIYNTKSECLPWHNGFC